MTASSVIWPIFAGLLVLAALFDLRSLRIPNTIAVAVLAVALAHAAIEPDGPWWQHPASFAIVLVAGALLFSRGWIGGGDAKLLAAAAAWFDLARLPSFAVAVAIMGGLLTLILLLLRPYVPAPDPDKGWQGFRRGRSIPYGVAIAAGAILVSLIAQPEAPKNPAFDSRWCPGSRADSSLAIMFGSLGRGAMG